jgi:hypothetical protein
MLVYLEVLCTALLARDSREIARLLKHPLARALPRRVREEAMAIMRAGPGSMIAPVQTLHFQHQTAHLLGVGAGKQSGVSAAQFELPLKTATGQR